MNQRIYRTKYFKNDNTLVHGRTSHPGRMKDSGRTEYELKQLTSYHAERLPKPPPKGESTNLIGQRTNRTECSRHFHQSCLYLRERGWRFVSSRGSESTRSKRTFSSHELQRFRRPKSVNQQKDSRNSRRKGEIVNTNLIGQPTDI